MSSDPNRLIAIQIKASSPELMTGLDVWLRLGLISQAQVRQLSETHLSCPLPQAVPQPVRRRALVPPVTPFPRVRTPILQQVWQSFKEELSVRWLLFLGLFLVVLSSSVLAATQWQQFPPVGQYGVLWLYTLVFWGVSFWSRQQNIPLTTRTLQTIVLLLVPINFWAMDTFGLWRNVWGWLVAAIASISLTLITLLQHRGRRIAKGAIAFLGLGYLQWGWAGFAWIAIYGGLIGTAVMLRRKPRLRIGRGLVLYALAVLLVRGIFVVQLPIEQLGFAIGLYGWLLASFARWKWVGAVGGLLLLVGWLVSVGAVTWQAVAVSGLGLQWCSQRLQRDWRRRDLLAIFVIGLQTMLLGWWWLPDSLRQAFLNWSVQLADAEAFPQSVHSLTLFPYVVGFVGFTRWLYRQEKPRLARFGEWLTLGLGVGLMLLSLANPVWRSLNFWLSSVTLITVTRRRPNQFLVYLSHLLLLMTICSTLDWWFLLTPLGWGVALLGLMVAEWGVVLARREETAIVLQSGWHYGFFLAGISYSVLWNQIFSVDGLWGCLWLLTPLMLTGVASRNSGRQQLGAIASSLALVLAQALTLWHPQARLVGLGVAMGVMLVNTRCLRHTLAATVTIGFALSFIAALLWGWLPPLGWFVAGAIAVWGLWLLRHWLRPDPLARLFSQAADRWAVSLCVFELAFLSLYGLRILGSQSAHPEPLGAALLIGGAISYRFWQQPNNRAVYGVSWAIEIGLVQLVMLMGGSVLSLAAANIILALAFCFGQPRLKPSLWELSSIRTLPLLFAILGLVCRFHAFTAYTGLLVLGAAVTGLGVGARSRRRSISYVSLIGVSVAVYELALYPLLHSSRGSLGDRLTILAVVATAIAFIYRLVGRWWSGERRAFNLSRPELQVAAHLHWATGSVLFLSASLININNISSLALINIVLGLILGVYALLQAKSHNPVADWWVYGGVAEITATVIFARLIWTPLSVLDPWRIVLVCGAALIIEQMPWRRWGWRSFPWHRAAGTLPTAIVIIISQTISVFSLLVAAAFYGYRARRRRTIRWSYLSVGFVDWAITLWLLERGTDLLWYALLVGLSILYIVQVEPSLQLPAQRPLRHHLRFGGCGIFCLVALFEQDTGLLPALISLASVLIGIGLQIRAFLFVGTLTFILTVLYQLLVLIMTYALVKWLVGLMAGIILISLAANFEQRRELVSSAFHWLTRLDQWE